MKRLLLDLTTITNDMTGVSRYGIELVREISKDPRLKLAVIVHTDLTPKHELFSMIRDIDVKVHRLNVAGIGPSREWKFLKFYYQVKKEFDVFHSITSNAPLAFFKKGVGTFHDLKYVLYPQYMGKFGSAKSFFIRCQFAIICRFFKAITTSSQSTLNDLLKVYPQLRKKINSKAQVVYLGLTPLETSNSTTKPLPVELPFFVYVGELRPHKNIENMIKAFERFASETNFKGRFLIGGKPHKTFSVKPKDDRVVFLGRVEDQDLGYLYSHAIGLFFASRYEGFGLPILEAMNLQTPVITSTISSMPEVAGNAAVLVHPDNIEGMADGLKSLAFDEKFRQDLISSGLEQMKHFSWKKCAQEMIEIYLKV